MMVNLYETFAAPLTHETMFEWHKMVMSGEGRIEVVGGYRTHETQCIVSGSLHDREVYFEAPPSSRMKPEMDAFVTWFNESGPGGTRVLPALTRAGIAQLHFACIHPFEGGNGRIAHARRDIARAESLPLDLDCPRLYHRAHPEGLLLRPRAQQ
jgi:Fic family protein